jgi:phosphoribosylformimino-5-aminoimidazole carboxamide ribotide isomerase
MSLLLIPAIDLKDGQCVRLRQGNLSEVTVFSNDPGEMSARWIAQGARRIHVVDLNGAVAGRPRNDAALKSIIKAAGDIPVQVGGGIRDLETVERMLDDGASFVVMGTAAVKNPGLLKDACAAFLGQIIVSIDAKDGKVATDGWSKLSGHEVIDLARKFEDDGVEAILYTDIGRDGMLTGVNHEATLSLARAVSIPVIASGGISGLEDIKILAGLEDEGIMGAILGRAVYEGQLDFAKAQELADQLGGD